MKILLRAAALLALSTLPCAANDIASEAVRVDTAPLSDLLIYPEASAPAAVLSLNDSRVSAEISAVIERVAVLVGERVEAGATLVELDCSASELAADELRARAAALDARIVFAASQVDRAKTLERSRTMAQQEMQQRESELAALRADRNALQALLDQNARTRDRCTVKAPFDALVAERLAGRGEYVTPGTPLLRLLDVERLEVSSDVLAGDAAGLNSASRAVFRYLGTDYPLTLRAVSPAIDPASGSREARLRFAAEPAPPGAVGRLIWRREPALPADYLSQRNGRLGVLLAEQQKARFYPLPGAQQGRPATIELPGWSRVITDGRLGLEDGDLLEEK